MPGKDSEPSRTGPRIDILECKGCGRCVVACPKSVLAMAEHFNERGYRYAEYRGEGCIGCGSCFYTCPEPYAIRVEVVPDSDDRPEE